MIEFTLRRLMATIPVLLGILLVAFTVLYLIPGDPALTVAGPRADETTLNRIRAEMGLDLPVHTRFVNYLLKICKGDFGESVISGKPVLSSLTEKLPVTLKLALISILFSTLIGVLMGVIGAVTRGKIIDRLCTLFSVSGISIPVFLSGLVFLYVFAVKLRWFPSSGFNAENSLMPFILPAFTLGIRSAAFLARIVRSSMIEVLNQDFIRTAKAKGLSPMRILFRHGLVNALIPIITVIGLDLSSYLNGSVIVETIYDLPGIGRYAMEAISQRDYPVVQGVVLLGAIVFIGVNLFIDLFYAWINPKVRDEMLGKLAK
ncbi:MAG: Glutathione transport system permease protein GsiC [bacterium ADurb.Bin157]|jgi:ABC-type dipeptide/oligopeptide/nickel transport system permease component|nr:ABC transporter permease [Candidatus Riflebacteria bacterium]MDD3377604.1 ABC transporter permease [Candidatus Riflebacteria bacterium]NCB46754.1 ABC transporter permease [bacterium]NLV94818.1 ABC transporter permease [Candidatus Riflebacteria bacterium]OQB45588.1 MAG: Glutathione transport system permease protein GsiC [bacterium ADurb.Bin157]